jgi:hypothetical protein
MNQHLLNTEGVHDMRALYSRLGCYPTSPNGDIALIRSHIAYWSGQVMADKVSIKASRGSSYRVAKFGKHDKYDVIVRIADAYDHREGVTGWTS